MQDDYYIIDGYGLIYRAYFALISRPLTDKDGQNVSAVHGFFRTLFALHREYGARKLVVALDPAGPTFRHEKYPEYKANRDSAPEDLHAQVPLIEELLAALGIPVIRIDSFEADDVIGSIADFCRREGIPCYLVSADKDLMQLVGDSVFMLRPQKGGGFVRIDADAVLQEKGVRPNQIIDYLALIGDKSDNIPGVPGIGEKTAQALLAQWDNLDNLYANLENAAKGSRLIKLKEGREKAYLSRELVTIICNLNIKNFPGCLERASENPQAAVHKFRERNLKTLASDAEVFLGLRTKDAVLSSPLGGPSAARYSALLSEADLEVWKEKIEHHGIVSLDTETDGINPMQAALVGLSFAVDASEGAYLPLIRPDGPVLDSERVIAWLNELFADRRIKIIGQNFKFDMKILRRAGVNIDAAFFDTMIAAWVLDASSALGMDALASRYLNVSTIKFSDVVKKGASFADVPLEQALNYAAEDAVITWRLYEHFMPLLKADPDRLKIFGDYEMPLQPIFTEMEMTGIGLDTDELDNFGVQLRADIDHLVKEIHRLCGREFNIASPKQLQTVLFEERGLTPGKKTKTGYSTDNNVLSNLTRDDPVPEKILLYRSLTKLKSTYVDVLPRMIHPVDGRIHTTYSQTGAATGRISSNHPNLQNIPIRDENGRRIRKAFKSRPGWKFLSADYSQIELVILAHVSQDAVLSAAFRDARDVHAGTAARLFSVSIDDVSPQQRRMAKAVNFGVMYGMSAFRLSNEMGISRKEAKHFIDSYFTTYAGIRNFIDTTVSLAERDGGVRTLEGRFRPLPGINSRNRVEKAAAERAAVNTRIQGTAADIMKAAMIAVYKELKQHFQESSLLLQVHDELLVEVPEGDVEGVAQLLKNTMEGTAQLSIPLRVSVESGYSWGDLH